VDLRAKVNEVKLTSIEVYSYEPERSLVNRTVLADVDPFHEADVSVVEQGLGAAVRIRRGACALHVRNPDKTVKICDARGLLAGTEGKEVKQLTADGGTTGDWVGRGILGLGQGRAGTQYGGAQNRTEGTHSAADKPAPRDERVMRVSVAR